MKSLKTSDGIFEFTAMPFGLCNAPATFQRLVDTVLGRLKWTIALAYLDDIICYSPDFESHLEHLALIFESISRARLKLKPSKCAFADNKLKYLGHIISEKGIEADPAKSRAISLFPTPKKVKDVQSFTSLCSYYKRFVRNFSQIAKPLTKLTESNTKFHWGPEQEKSFLALKSALTSPPCLSYPDDKLPVRVRTDASLDGLGAVVQQLEPDGEWHPIAYASRGLRRYERNYSVTELECLAVVFAVERFRPYLYGKPFVVVTDHCSLCDLLNLKNPHGRLAKWSLRLQPYELL